MLGRNRGTDVENRLMNTGGEKGGWNELREQL